MKKKTMERAKIVIFSLKDVETSSKV
jgi:hypothetical protein